LLLLAAARDDGMALSSAALIGSTLVTLGCFAPAYELAGCTHPEHCGLFAQTVSMCHGAPAYKQPQGSHVLFRSPGPCNDNYASDAPWGCSHWNVGPSARLADCSDTVPGNFLISGWKSDNWGNSPAVAPTAEFYREYSGGADMGWSETDAAGGSSGTWHFAGSGFTTEGTQWCGAPVVEASGSSSDDNRCLVTSRASAPSPPPAPCPSPSPTVGSKFVGSQLLDASTEATLLSFLDDRQMGDPDRWEQFYSSFESAFTTHLTRSTTYYYYD
jgi:hypothetical protein